MPYHKQRFSGKGKLCIEQSFLVCFSKPLLLPIVPISQSVTPKAHTSEAVVNSRAVMLSMAIHLRGRRPLVFFTYTSSTSRERPKSVIFKSLSLAMRTLRQAKSRWTIFKLAKYSCTHEGEREGGREAGRGGRLQR